MNGLSKAEIADALQSLPEWRLHQGALVREWPMENFDQAISFVIQVAELARMAGHHPDLDIRSTRVRISLTSHDVDAITSQDILLANTLDRAFPL